MLQILKTASQKQVAARATYCFQDSLACTRRSVLLSASHHKTNSQARVGGPVSFSSVSSSAVANRLQGDRCIGQINLSVASIKFSPTGSREASNLLVHRNNGTPTRRRHYSSKPPPKDEGDITTGSREKDEITDDDHRLRLAKLMEESVVPTLKRVEDSVKPTLKRVTEWYAGDLAAVYAIAIILIFVVTAPMVSRQMRKSDVDYEQVDSEDPIAHTEILARQLLFNLEGDNAEKESNIPKATDLLQAILSSEPLKDALIKLLSKVLESDDFQKSAKELVRTLWNDLVEDPETTAQVVHLLNHVIQTDEIRHAAQELVIQIVNDKEVFEELVQLLHRLGQDHEVLEATQNLLLQSAHKALNDEEILDHSMEFVADVVADDTIQRTTGDALRQTVSHAVRPAISAVLMATGVVFLLFSLSALSNARLSDREVRLLEQSLSQVSKSIQAGAVQAVPSLVSLISSLLVSLERAITSSARTTGGAVSQLGITTWHSSTRWLILFPVSLARSVGSIFVWMQLCATHGLAVISTTSIVGSASYVIAVPMTALRRVGASTPFVVRRFICVIAWPFVGKSGGGGGGDSGQDQSLSQDSASLKMKID